MPPEKSSQTLDEKIKTDERLRGSHAWNTCDGGVRGLVYSAEMVKGLAGKKRKKNYWKVGAFIAGGISAIAGSIIYFSPQTPSITQQEVLSREEALERFAPRIEYYGIPDENIIPSEIDMENYGYLQFKESYWKSNIEEILNKFCSERSIWNLKLFCEIPYCYDDENKLGEICDRKETIIFRMEDIVDIKGVIINDELAYIDISTIESEISNVSSALRFESQMGEVYNEILENIDIPMVHHKSHGTFKLRTHKPKKDYDYRPKLTELLDDGVLEPIVEIDGVRVTRERYESRSSVESTNREIMEGANFDIVRHQLSLYIEKKLGDNGVLNELFKGSIYDSSLYSPEEEVVLFEWDYSIVNRKIKPDQTKNTPEESILLIYELVDSIRTILNYVGGSKLRSYQE
ncbi:hypothetical protein HY636_04865 [Candidatus Woesearchaeota archaeon]|nr:hypothetical protein [Candidatus Woesearchaeota archaeon]